MVLAKHLDGSTLIEVSQVVDLTDKPIELRRHQIGWSRVRSSSARCICCCVNNSITLVTWTKSCCYALQRLPMRHIRSAQASPQLNYLALWDGRQLMVLDLVELQLESDPELANQTQPVAGSQTRLVDLGSQASELLFWRWLDHNTLGLLTSSHLFTCQVDQIACSHPAQSALSQPMRLLQMQLICQIELPRFCQPTEIQRDQTGSLFALSSLYSSNNLQAPQTLASTHLRHNSSSVPTRLSQIAVQHSLDSGLTSTSRSQANGPFGTSEEVCGLVQVHCHWRHRNQLIQAHAIAFAFVRKSTLMVAVNKLEGKMRVHIVEMATQNNSRPVGQLNSSASCRFNNEQDFPTTVVCSTLPTDGNNNAHHIAFITTKRGQLFVCSIERGTILFSTSIIDDLISSAVLDDLSSGLSVICRNGQVFLVTLKAERLLTLLERHRDNINSMIYKQNISSSASTESLPVTICRPLSVAATTTPSKHLPVRSNLDVFMSTKL